MLLYKLLILVAMSTTLGCSRLGYQPSRGAGSSSAASDAPANAATTLPLQSPGVITRANGPKPDYPPPDPAPLPLLQMLPKGNSYKGVTQGNGMRSYLTQANFELSYDPSKFQLSETDRHVQVVPKNSAPNISLNISAIKDEQVTNKVRDHSQLGQYLSKEFPEKKWQAVRSQDANGWQAEWTSDNRARKEVYFITDVGAIFQISIVSSVTNQDVYSSQLYQVADSIRFDITPPKIEDMVFTETADAGSPWVLYLKITDDLSGVDTDIATILKIVDRDLWSNEIDTSQVKLETTRDKDWYKVVVPISATTRPGSYKLSIIKVADKQGNVCRYNYQDGMQAEPFLKCNSIDHRFIRKATFRVNNPSYSDQFPPAIINFIVPTQVESNSYFDVQFSLCDQVSLDGASVELRFSRIKPISIYNNVRKNRSFSLRAKLSQKEGKKTCSRDEPNYSAQFFMPKEIYSGEHWLSSLMVIDHFGQSQIVEASDRDGKYEKTRFPQPQSPISSATTFDVQIVNNDTEKIDIQGPTIESLELLSSNLSRNTVEVLLKVKAFDELSGVSSAKLIGASEAAIESIDGYDRENDIFADGCARLAFKEFSYLTSTKCNAKSLGQGEFELYIQFALNEPMPVTQHISWLELSLYDNSLNETSLTYDEEDRTNKYRVTNGIDRKTSTLNIVQVPLDRSDLPSEVKSSFAGYSSTALTPHWNTKFDGLDYIKNAIKAYSESLETNKVFPRQLLTGRWQNCLRDRKVIFDMSEEILTITEVVYHGYSCSEDEIRYSKTSQYEYSAEELPNSGGVGLLQTKKRVGNEEITFFSRADYEGNVAPKSGVSRAPFFRGIKVESKKSAREQNYVLKFFGEDEKQLYIAYIGSPSDPYDRIYERSGLVFVLEQIFSNSPTRRNSFYTKF